MQAYEDFLRNKRFTLLDGLRGLAILAVVWHHSAGASASDPALLGRGYFGVDLFFVLSGFLITHLLMREKAEYGEVSLRNFYLRRTLRIFPLFYAYIGVLFFLTLFGSPQKFQELLAVLHYYLLYLINWIPAGVPHPFERGWSLSVEEQFYLFWPVMLLFFRLSVPLIFVLCVSITTLLVSEGLIFPSLSSFIDLIIPFRTILMGCVLAIALNHKYSYGLLNSFLGKRYSILIVFIALIAALAVKPGSLAGMYQFLVHCLMVGLVAAAVLNEKNVLCRPLEFRPLAHIGVVSYGIYVLHGQFWGAVERLLSNFPDGTLLSSRFAFFVVFSAISILVATVSFYAFERYFINMKHRFYAHKNHPGALSA